LRECKELFDRVKIAYTAYIVASLERVAYRPYLEKMKYTVIERRFIQMATKSKFKRKIKGCLGLSFRYHIPLKHP